MQVRPCRDVCGCVWASGEKKEPQVVGRLAKIIAQLTKICPSELSLLVCVRSVAVSVSLRVVWHFGTTTCEPTNATCAIAHLAKCVYVRARALDVCELCAG